MKEGKEEIMHSVCCEIIKTCPLSCLHCSAKSHINTNKFIPFDELKKIVNQAHDSGVETFYISGGEPLLYPELKQLVKYIKDLNISPVIYSSGALPLGNTIIPIQKETLNNLENTGLDSIAFSIFSLNSKKHDEITNTPNSLKVLYATLKNAKEIFYKTNIELSFMPLTDTWEEIDEIINFANTNGIYKLNILKLIYQGRAKESGIISRALSEKDEVDFVNKLKNIKNTSTIIEISKLYDCEDYEHLQISPHTSGVNEYLVTYKQEFLLGRRFRD